MKLLWVTLLTVLRPLYFIYALSCLLVPFLLIYGMTYVINASFLHFSFPSPEFIILVLAKLFVVLFIILMITIPVLVYYRRSEGNKDHETDPDPNPFQSAFMSWFASLRWYWNTAPGSMARVGLPSGYLVENPMSYRISGNDMRDVLSKLQPGDILLRGYDGYVDGNFIRLSSVCSKNGFRPGWFTHVALYVGKLDEEDRKKVPAAYQHDKNFFSEGPQMVLHSMAKGVHSEDILTWLRCDYMTILRIKPDPAPGNEDQVTGVSRAEAIQEAKLSALEKVGEPYDFECIETHKYTRFSCAELVYYCYRSIHTRLGLAPQLHALYPLGKLFRHWCILGRSTVTPDDYYDLTKTGQLEVIWVDKISKEKVGQGLATKIPDNQNQQIPSIS